MAAMTNLLVKDDAATPTEYTLYAITDNPEPFWRANVSGISIEGQPRLTVTTNKLKNGGYKFTAKLEVPVMETLGASGSSAGYVAPPRVAYVTTGLFTMFSDKRATTADRSNTLKMLIGLMQGASSTTATGVLANTAAGGAFAASVLPLVQSVTSLILPN